MLTNPTPSNAWASQARIKDRGSGERIGTLEGSMDTGEGQGSWSFLVLAGYQEDFFGAGEFCIPLPFYMLAKFPLLGSHSSKRAPHPAASLMKIPQLLR